MFFTNERLVNFRPNVALFQERCFHLVRLMIATSIIQEPRKLTAIKLYNMFSPCYSLEGSNAREREVETVLLDEFLGGM